MRPEGHHVETDWESYPVIRFTGMPEVKFRLINRHDSARRWARARVLITTVPRRDRQRDLRRDRQRDAAAAVHAGPREGGAEVAPGGWPRARPHQGGPRSAIASSTSPRASDEEGLRPRPAPRASARRAARRASPETTGSSTSISSASEGEEAAHREPRAVVVDGHPAGEPARRAADDVDAFGALGRVGGDVAVALVLQQVDVDAERGHGGARERRRELRAVALVELGEHGLERGEGCDDGLLAGEHRQRE